MSKNFAVPICVTRKQGILFHPVEQSTMCLKGFGENRAASSMSFCRTLTSPCEALRTSISFPVELYGT